MSWIDDAFSEDKNKNSWIDDAFSDNYESSGIDYYDNSPSQSYDGEDTSSYEELNQPKVSEEVKTPDYSVEQAAIEANGGKTNLQAAIENAFEGQDQAAANTKEQSDFQQKFDDANFFQKLGMVAKGIDRQAYNQFMGGISGTAASLLGEGTIADKIYKSIAGQNATNPVSEWNEARQKRTALDQQEFGQMVEGNKGWENVNKYGTMAWSQAPSAVLSLMMAPISATAGATTAGLEYASSLAQSAGLQKFATTAAHGLGELVKNPQFLLSYSQESGNAYNSALEDGATPQQASLYASLYGTFSAMIENGGVDEALGGMQNYPKAVKDAVKNHDAKTAAVEFAKSIFGEIGEEWQQGGLENLLKRGYGKDTPWYSTEDPNAVINPKQMLETAKDTAITTALLQGGQHAVMSGVNAAQNKLYDAVTNNATEKNTAETKANTTDVKSQIREAFGEETETPTAKKATEGQKALVDSMEEANGINASEETDVQPMTLAEQKAQAEEELRQAQEAYDAAADDPEMQPTLLEAVEAAQAKLDDIIAQENATQNSEDALSEFESQGEEKSDTSSETDNGENWSGPEVQTQSTFHRQLTEEEKARADLNPENDTHIQHHDTEVDTFANNRITEKGHEGAREDLMSRNPAEWDDVDVRTAQMLLAEELENARNLEGTEQDEAYKRIAQLKNAYNQQGTESGRALRQRSRFGGSKTEIVSEAANILYGEENAKNLRKVSPEQKAEIMKQVDAYSSQLQDAAKGDTASVKDIILQVAQARNTHANFDTNNTRLSKAIDAVAKMDGGEEFLRQLATTQIRSIASDQIKPSFWDKAKAVRYLFMLSNPATASRNVVANTVFGNIIDAISSDMASPIDALMSMATGQRSVAAERLSKEGIKGSVEAGLKSWLEVSLDAEAEQSTYAYNEIKGRTFKSSSENFIERFMSALERNQGYQLKMTDQIAKGGIEAEIKRNLMAQGMDEKTATEAAKEEAKYRTLQNESGMSKAANKLRDVFNVASIKDKNGKKVYGLGDDLLPFAQVPANVVKTEIDLNPLSIIKASAQVFNVMSKGQNATTQEQRAAAKAFGQAVNGTAIVALSALMSAKGILRYTDDEDKDQKQLHKAQGKNGLQINFSAAGRLFTGRDPSPQAGDKWGNIGWMPQLNSLLIIGNMVYDDYKDMPEHKELADWANLAGDVAVDSLQGMLESIMEFPAVSTITSMVNAAKYANIPEDATEEEKNAIKFGAVLADKAANTITSFAVPNAIRAVAAGLDDTERNLYSADNRVGQAIDSIKAGIPDNPLIPEKYTRGSLPALTDNLGNPFKNEGGANQFFNKVILPGAITTDKNLPVLDEIDRISTATGNMDAIPKKNGAYSVTYGDEKFKTTSEEQEAWHEYAGDRIEKYTGELINSPYYKLMSENQIADTMAKINQQAYNEADKNFLEGKGIDATDKLIDGVQKSGDKDDKTALDPDNVAKYFAYRTMLSDYLKDKDYTNADQLTKWYNGLGDNLKTVLIEQDTDLKRVLEYQKIGLGSETYSKVKAAMPEAKEDLDADTDTSAKVRLYALANANISEKDRKNIIQNLKQGDKKFIGSNGLAAYNAASAQGLSTLQAAQFFDICLNCKIYKDTNEPAKNNGQITADALAFALRQIPGITEKQRETMFYQIRKEVMNDYNKQNWAYKNGKLFTYASEVEYLTNSKNKARYETNVKISPSAEQSALLGSAKK